VNGTFMWSYGVTDRLQLDFDVPMTFGQGGTGIAPVTGGAALEDTAVRDLRFGLAYALVPRARVSSASPKANGFALAGRFEVVAPTGDQAQFAGDASGVFVPSVAGDFRQGRFFAGAEAGARLRSTSELLGARVGSQAVLALGAGFDVLPRELLTFALEARALPTFAEQHSISTNNGTYVSTPDGSHITPAEWQLSARTAPLVGGDLSIQASGGGGIPLSSETAITAPRFRFTLGLRWAPLGRDTDGDGVLDKDDRCLLVPEPPGQTPRDGCPHPVETPAPPPSAAWHSPAALGETPRACTREPEPVPHEPVTGAKKPNS
jgi:hypothetical protein